VNLQVVVPEAFILGSGELHVDMGSAINLVCIIEKVSGAAQTTGQSRPQYAFVQESCRPAAPLKPSLCVHKFLI
jgi:hypothetical protein